MFMSYYRRVYSLFNLLAVVLVPAKTDFCSSQKGRGQDSKDFLFSSTSPHFPGMGEGVPSRSHSVTAQSGVVGSLHLVCESFTSHVHWYCRCYCLLFFLIAVPINCSYFNPWSLPFLSPVLLSSPPQGKGWWGVCGLECFSGSTDLGNTIPSAQQQYNQCLNALQTIHFQNKRLHI